MPTCRSSPRPREYDPAKKGFIITFTIEEGPHYRFGTIDVQIQRPRRRLRRSLRSRAAACAGRHLQRRGDRKDRRGSHHRGRAGAAIRSPPCGPRGDRNSADPHDQCRLRRRRGHARLYRAHQHPRQYRAPATTSSGASSIIAEGDPYNRALIDRAERRLKNLNFFKIGQDHQRARARRPTAWCSMSTSRSNRPATSRSWAATRPRTACWRRCRCRERNLLGTGRMPKLAVTYGNTFAASNCQLRRALFPRSAAGGGHRPVRQEDAGHSYCRMAQNRTAAPEARLRAARRPALQAALFAVHAARSRCRPISNDCNNLNPDFFEHLPDAGRLGSRRGGGAGR